MIKITITSKDVTTGFTGAVEVLYGPMLVGEGCRVIEVVDFRGAQMSMHQVVYLMNRLPRTYGGDFLAALGTDKLNVVESSVEMDFERDFWLPFGMKVHKDVVYKQYWLKMTEPDRVLCCHGMMAYLRHLSKYPWKSKMLPKTWFKNKAWQTDWDNVNH